MYAAARSVRTAVARSGNYAVRYSVCYVSGHDLTLAHSGYSAIPDREEYEQQNHWCVLKPHSRSSENG